MDYVSKLQELYASYDELKSSGEDVVHDIKKEITNLELEYLKNEVLPQTAAFLGKRVSSLRCQIDLSFQYDEEQNIDYSYCTSNSTMMFRDKVNCNNLVVKAIPIEKVQEAEKRAPIVEKTDSHSEQESKMTSIKKSSAISKKETTDTLKSETTQISKPVKNKATDIRIVKYTDKSFVVYGDTRDYMDVLRGIKGVFSFYLKEGPGWIFSRRKEGAVRKALADVLPEEPYVFEEENVKKAIAPKKPIPYENIEAPSSAVCDCSYNEEWNDFAENLSASNSYTHYEGHETLQEYFDLFANMRTVKLKGLKGPQKAILLLAIFRGVKEGWIKGNKIPITPKLIWTFTDVWEKYVPESWPFVCNARHPYIHLASESFYHLHTVKKIKNINISWTVPEIMEHCKCAYLDDNLFRFAENPYIREEMEDFLIKTFIKDQKE